VTEIQVVTGASSGVGRALCKYLAQHDYTVMGLARRQPELEALQAEYPRQIHIMSVDLGTCEGREQVRQRIEGEFLVRNIVHSAAIAAGGFLRDLSYQRYREMMAINVEAPLFLTQALLPCMCSGARVLHLSSGSAYRAVAYNGLYSISKAALLMLYKAWNADFAEEEIVVGSAMPGVVDGPMQDAAREGDHPGVEMFRDYKDKGLLIQPERVAEFLFWLLFITSDREFSAQDWNIFEESHHGNWLHRPLSG
jgi:benzil reductase ((S)-benzoin forming)